jgi:hypothetical protein
MDELKLAVKISKRLNVPFYVARYQTRSNNRVVIFFKEQDLPPKALRFHRRFSLGYKYNSEFKIFETNIEFFKNEEGKYKMCYNS